MAKKDAVSIPVPESTKQTAVGPSWFTRGEAGFERKHQQDRFSAMRKEKNAPRFYLKDTPGKGGEGDPKDNEARIVFLDSAGFWVHEHNLKLEGKWGNYFTCLKDYQPCDICNQLNEKSVYTCYFTIIDTRKYVRKDGTVSKFRKVLLPAKGAAIDVIETLKKQHGDLRGLVVDVKRMNARDPNCGRDFIVVMKDGNIARVDPSKRFEGENSAPFDYVKILAPPTPEELAIANVSAAHIAGSDDDVESVSPTSVVGSDEELGSLLGD